MGRGWGGVGKLLLSLEPEARSVKLEDPLRGEALQFSVLALKGMGSWTFPKHVLGVSGGVG